MSKPQGCNFCLIPQEKTTESFKKLHGDLLHTLNIPGVPNTFTVLQDVVPIAELGAHILLMPNLHDISLASVADKEGMLVAKDAIVEALQKHFPDNPIFTFEHGPGFIQGESIACGGCHMDHAHGHIMVLPKKTSFDMIQQRMEEILILNGWKNPRSHAVESIHIFTDSVSFAGMQPYLHIGMIFPEGKTISYTYVQKSKSFNVPSQLLRLVVADVVYDQKDPTYWHWRDVESGLTSPDRMHELKTNVTAFRKLTGF
ncbi:MAG: hypothetical protein V1922_03865 [bacterium]